MNAEKRLIGNTILFSIATFFSRLLGLVREIVISSLFGLGKTTDAFFLAFTIPNLLRQLLAEGAFNNSFIPIYSDVLTEEGCKEQREFLSVVFTFLVIILVLISFLGVIFAPFLIKIFAPGFLRDQVLYSNAVSLLKILFPYIFFISLASFLSGILNAHGSFFFPALTPLWLNLSMILFSLLFWRVFGIKALVIGVIIGGIFQLLFLVPFVIKRGIRFSFSLNFKNRYLINILIIMAPAIISVLVNQLNIVIDRIFASFLEVGSISALYYSNRLVQFPLGVFGIALSTVFFPLVSKYISEKQYEKFETYTSLGIRTGAVILIPFSLYLFIFSTPIISIIYEHGIFSSQNVLMTSLALKYYSIGIFFYSGANFLNRIFYSTKDSKTPMYVSIASVITNIFLDFLFMPFLSYKGLALATSLSGIFNFSILFMFLLKKRYITNFGSYKSSLNKIFITCVIITGVSILFIKLFENHFWYGFVIPSILFFVIYVFILYLLGASELDFIISSFKRGV